MRKFLLLSIAVSAAFTAFSQDFSNKGKDFWTGYGYHQVMFGAGANGGAQKMVLYFATDQVTNIVISIPGIGYTQNITTPALPTVTTSTAIPQVAGSDARLTSEGLSNKGIHITSDKPMVAYAHVYNSSVSGATILYPTNTLGKEYYSVNYTNISNVGNANCFFYVVAADTGTTAVEITPTAATMGGWTAGTTYTVNLTQGQIYNVMGTTAGNSGVDLTGSIIKSVAAGGGLGGGCKKIAVFSGSGRIAISCNGSAPSSDNYMVQAMPKTAWGKKYLTVPTANYTSTNGTGLPLMQNIYRICVTDPATVVTVNGAPIAVPLINNFYYQLASSTTLQKIEADKPIMVAQYLPSQGGSGCGTVGGDGDPEVIYLSAVEQNINTVQWDACNNFAINLNKHYINMVIPNAGTAISSAKLDGVTIPPAKFIVHPQDLNYAYAVIGVTGANGSSVPHIVTSDSGFNAIAYGYGGAESYGYNAGTNIKDLYQQIGVVTQYGIEPTPSVCTNSPFKFKVSLPYIPDSMYWNFHNAAGMLPNNTNVMVYNPGNIAQDSSTVVNGKTIYWYSLPTQYFFTTVGVYPVTISTYVPNADCGSVQDIDFNLTVSAPPVADFSWVSGGCVAEPYSFQETTPQLPKPTYHWWWDFADPGSGASNNSLIKNPTHTFSAPGTYNVRFSDITTPGCLSDTIIHQIIVAPLPSATISGTMAVCLNAPSPVITFTATDGTAPYTFTYNINGGANQTINTVAGNTITINAPTNVAGVFIYTLVSVKNTGSTLCTQNVSGQQATVTVNPLPTAAISGAATVCLNAPSPLVTFTGAAGTAPYTFTYTINGGANQTITTVAGNSVTVAAPTNTPGTFIYALVSVQDASSTTCSQPQAGTTTVIVNPLPTASISGTIAVCLNDPSPNITFTGAGGVVPYTFTYNINGGANQTITTVAGNSVTIAVPTNVAGTFSYNLVSVQDGSSTLCSQAQSGSSVVTVNPLPTASIAGNITVCLNAASPNITFTGAAGTAPYTFTYNINGGANQTVTTVAGNSITVAVPTTVAGTFVYTLVSVQDGTSTACTQVQSGAATVIVNPLPTAAINGTIAVCLNAPSPNITFTGAVGTAPYTFTYNINGGANLTVTTVAGNSVTVAVPTNVAGTFVYNLVSVQEGSANLCTQVQSGSATVTVNPLPTAAISGTTAVCLNDASPLITFTGAVGTPPYTFTYNINGGANQTVTTVAGNSVTIAVPTNVAGLFTYNLLSVQDASSTLCLQAQGGSAAVTVRPLPTPNFNYTAPFCATRTISFTDASVANVGILNSWSWDFGDPASGGANTSSLQNPSHVFSTSGVYTVSLTITTSLGCTIPAPFTKVVTIHNRPNAGFIIPDVCINDIAAVFTDTSSIVAPDTFDPAGYDWNFGDGSPHTFTKNGTHLYLATGVYQVTHVVTTLNGCKDTIVQPITINGANPVAAFTINNPATLCANDSVAIVSQSTVNFGNVTKVEIIWDFVNQPAVIQTDNSPFFGKVYKHLYPNFQAPLTKPFTIRMRAYSGTLCFNDVPHIITVNAAPHVQFNNMPNTCLLVPPFQITQASETGGVPGNGVYTGPGVSPTGIFSPGVAGIGTHTIKYTYTSTAGGCVDTMSNTITVLDTAHANFTYITPICENTAASFTDVSTAPASVTITNTVWDFGDGSPLQNHPPGANFTHLFPGATTYNVKMYNVSAVGCNSTVYTQAVTVDPNHTITLTSGPASTNQTLCINTLITPITYNLGGGATGATVTGLPAGVNYVVTGTTLTISGSPTTTIGSPFNYAVATTGNTCTIANANGTIAVSSNHTLTLTSVATTTDQRVCLNTSITDITYTLGGGATGVTITGLPPGVTYSVTGNTVTITGSPSSTLLTPYNYSIITTGNSCVTASDVGVIKVSPYPKPVFAFDKLSYCIPNATVTFNNSSTIEDGTENAFTYAWDFGDPASGANNTSAAKTPSHYYIGAGPFIIKLVVTSGFGCSHDTSITLNTIHPQPKASFVPNKTSVCIADDVTFTDQSVANGGIINQWNWDFGDGSQSTGNPVVSHLYISTDTFHVSLYVTNTFGCNSDTLTQPFAVYPYPVVDAGPDRFVLEGGSIVLEPVVTGNDLQYLWTPNLYMANNAQKKPTIVNPKDDITYTLTVTARGGCVKSDAMFVKLLRFPKIPNTFTPNNDGINDTWRIDYLNTYPNNRVQVFTRTGQLIFESHGYNLPWDGTFKGKPLPFDTYYYIIEPGNGRDPITGYVTIIK